MEAGLFAVFAKQTQISKAIWLTKLRSNLLRLSFIKLREDRVTSLVAVGDLSIASFTF